MNSRLVPVSVLLVVILSGCVGGGSGLSDSHTTEITDYTLGEVSCESPQTDTTIEKVVEGENTLLKIDGAVQVNGDYYELTAPEFRQTTGEEYEIYVESHRSQERTEVCTASIPYTLTLDLGPNGGDSTKMTLYHDGSVQGKILPDNMEDDSPLVL